MSRSNQFISLAGGVLVFFLGVRRVIQEGDWVLVTLGVLILAFSVSSIMRSRRKP
jgi:hypothetical protein